MTYIDEGNALTLEEVLKTGLKYSRDRHSAAHAFRAMRSNDGNPLKTGAGAVS